MAEKATENLIEVKILRDFWDGEGKRQRAGTVVSIPVDAAFEGIENGMFKRVKKG